MSKLFFKVLFLFSIATLQSQNHDNFASENRYANHSLMTPTAFSLPEGEGFYKNSLLMQNSVNYGATDHFSIGASFNLLGLIDGGQYFSLSAAGLTTKYSTPIGKKTAIAGGLTLSRIGSQRNNVTESCILYSLFTWGNKNRNITVGGGYPILYRIGGNEMDSRQNRPLFLNILGQYRLSNRFFLLTENWFSIGNSDRRWIGGLGARYMGNRAAFDFAFVFARQGHTGEFTVIRFPFMSISIPFKTN